VERDEPGFCINLPDWNRRRGRSVRKTAIKIEIIQDGDDRFMLTTFSDGLPVVKQPKKKRYPPRLRVHNSDAERLFQPAALRGHHALATSTNAVSLVQKVVAVA